MTRQQYQDAAQQVRMYGNALLCSTFILVLLGAVVAINAAGPQLSAFGAWVRGRINDEAIAGLIFGLVGGALIAPIVLVPFLPLLLVDHRFGLRCPQCERSVTLRCSHSQVLKSGKCGLCGYELFEPLEGKLSSHPAERS